MPIEFKLLRVEEAAVLESVAEGVFDEPINPARQHVSRRAQSSSAGGNRRRRGCRPGRGGGASPSRQGSGALHRRGRYRRRLAAPGHRPANDGENVRVWPLGRLRGELGRDGATTILRSSFTAASAPSRSTWSISNTTCTSPRNRPDMKKGRRFHLPQIPNLGKLDYFAPYTSR